MLTVRFALILGTLRVLEEIKFAVEKRLPPDSHPVRTRDRIRELVPNMANNAKRLYKDQEELPDLRRKLQSVVDAFTVRDFSTLEVSGTVEVLNARASGFFPPPQRADLATKRTGRNHCA
jgi:hypothetical protein